MTFIRSARAAALFQESAAVYKALGDPFYQAEALAWLVIDDR